MHVHLLVSNNIMLGYVSKIQLKLLRTMSENSLSSRTFEKLSLGRAWSDELESCLACATAGPPGLPPCCSRHTGEYQDRKELRKPCLCFPCQTPPRCDVLPFGASQSFLASGIQVDKDWRSSDHKSPPFVTIHRT